MGHATHDAPVSPIVRPPRTGRCGATLIHAPRTTMAVFRFEWRRTQTLGRVIFSLALALFPALLVGIIRFQAGPSESPELPTLVLFFLIPEVVCLMGLLLWATPVIHCEMEGRTWPYLAVRPCGKGSILIGKYLTAVGWTTLVAWLGLTLSLAALQMGQGALQTWATLAALALLASLTYGALYMLLGVLFLRRALVVAVAYTFLMEFIVSFIPAVVHQITVQYHLRCLLAKWLGWTGLPHHVGLDEQLFFSTAPAWHHVLVLLGMTAGLLSAAILVLRQRELVKPTGD